MPDADLPPVGELVQITGRSDREIGDVPVLAIREADGTLRLPYVGDLGLDRVQSWCRVLVVPDTEEQIERLCQVSHEAYEAAAAGYGWETQQASRKPWAEVPEANKAAVRTSIRAVLAAVRGAAIR